MPGQCRRGWRNCGGLASKRLAILDLRLWAGPSLDVSGDVLVLRVCNRADADEFGTSCLMALDPRSVRMPLLPAGSRAEAFRGERGLAAEVDAVVGSLVAGMAGPRMTTICTLP